MQRLLTRPMLTLAGGLALLIGFGAYFVFGRTAADPVAAASPTATVAATSTASPAASSTATPTSTPSATAEVAARCPLNGMPMADASLAERTALVVQIENHPLARPARNLNRADIVFEAPVEGDTTRFSAVFLCQPTEGLSGPVRSARYYDIDLWQDLHVLPVGFGASNGALRRFAAAGMPYVNGLDGGWPWYSRVSGRAAPHNLYADIERVRSSLGSMQRLDALAARAGNLRPPFEIDPDVTPEGGHDVASVTIRTNSYWRFGWRWDASAAAWLREDASKPVLDAVDDQPVSARTVVVQRVTQEEVLGDPDPGGNSRRLQHMVGSGKGTVYVDGQAFAVRWSRPKASDGTSWTFADSGDPVVLPAGRIWWEIVPTTASVSED